jgi:hypothetical protein
VNAAGERERLPASIGGLIDLGLAAALERAGLYALLSLGVFALCGIVEALWHTSGTADRDLKITVLGYVEIFGLAYLVAVVTLGVAARAAGERPATRALLEAALARYLPVFGTMVITQLLLSLTVPFSALGPLPDRSAIYFVTAPVTWFVWGIIGLASPYAALSVERPGLAIIGAFGRAFGAAMYGRNLVRLCVIAFATIVPTLLSDVLFDVLTRHGVHGADFWSSVPIDVLTAAPLTALQTVFALDFTRSAAARRNGR